MSKEMRNVENRSRRSNMWLVAITEKMHQINKRETLLKIKQKKKS